MLCLHPSSTKKSTRAGGGTPEEATNLYRIALENGGKILVSKKNLAFSFPHPKGIGEVVGGIYNLIVFRESDEAKRKVKD